VSLIRGLDATDMDLVRDSWWRSVLATCPAAAGVGRAFLVEMLDRALAGQWSIRATRRWNDSSRSPATSPGYSKPSKTWAQRLDDGFERMENALERVGQRLDGHAQQLEGHARHLERIAAREARWRSAGKWLAGVVSAVVVAALVMVLGLRR